MNPIIASDDALTEYLIEHSYRQLMRATDEAGKRHWCDRLVYWVGQRKLEPERQTA